MAIQEVGRRGSGNNDQKLLPNPTQPLSQEVPGYIAPLPSELAVSVSADQANRKKKWQSGSQGDERPSTLCRRPTKRSCREAYVMGPLLGRGGFGSEFAGIILEGPVPCQDLQSVREENGCLDESLAKKVLLQLTTSLKHCESRGVLYRDVKPQNLLISTDSHDIKLLDFGCGDLVKDLLIACRTGYCLVSGGDALQHPVWLFALQSRMVAELPL
ncbi:hypothetical protein G5714_000683 [Onychostoma macrolepis]|uniref:non-specific serine/threonine protein kinase n=1 Tax=Onychostoma macrolepis TaxID=369639 RepID=A0A7J6DH23_9TELE|nr:hypothetical protein G5714_000683 [Onychostoma macrolepis]